MKDARDTHRNVVCAGRLYCDLVFSGTGRLPTMGQEIFAEGLSLHAGGGAFITAAWLAALGRNADLVATLPAAPFEDTVRDQIARAGVGASGCALPPMAPIRRSPSPCRWMGIVPSSPVVPGAPCPIPCPSMAQATCI